MMTSVCLYYKVHQPYRLKGCRVKGANATYSYEDMQADESSIYHLADHCYLPANRIIRELIEMNEGRFRVSFSISGVAIELFQKHRPDVLDSFKELVRTGAVEILAETYYHSLSFLHSKKEFERQLKKHAALVNEVFGIQPTIFRNTELIYNNQLAGDIKRLGFEGILCEGMEKILRGRSPNRVYQSPGGAKLFLRNASLSDDIAFRFDDANWDQYPLTSEKFAEWIHNHPKDTNVINLMLDYETFGVHKKAESGIFDFLRSLPSAVLSNSGFTFSTPSVVLSQQEAGELYDVPFTISWEEVPGSGSAWFENMRQNNMLKKIYSIEKMVLDSENEKTIETWARLQSAEYFYYMSEESIKAAAYRYHNPFSTPEEAFENYTNIVAAFEISLIEREIMQRKRSFSRASFINSFL